MTRQQLIDKRRLWQVYENGSETILHEGSKTACFRFIRDRFGMRSYRTGTVRIGMVIWEA